MLPRTARRNRLENKKSSSAIEGRKLSLQWRACYHSASFSIYIGFRSIQYSSQSCCGGRRVYTNVPFFLDVVGIVPKCFPIGLFVSYVGSESRESIFAAQVVIPMWKTWCYASVCSFTGLRSFWCIFGAHLVADLSASEYSCEVLVISAFFYTKTFLLADKSATENILSRHHENVTCTIHT